MPKGFKPPEPPGKGADVREWVSYRTREELYWLADAAAISPYEIGETLEINYNTFRTLYHGLRNRNPTAEVLQKLHELNIHPAFKHIPRKASDGLLINIHYIITGERVVIGKDTAGEQIRSLSAELERLKKDNHELRDAIIGYEKIIKHLHRNE